MDETEQLFKEMRQMAVEAVYRGDDERLNRIIDITFPMFEKKMHELEIDIKARYGNIKNSVTNRKQ